jgi:cyclomaltodextrinase
MYHQPTIHAKPSDNPDYKINKPDELTRKEQILLLIHQFTFIGAPQIWNGEEVGMWGADDPDCRKPVIWDDIVYEDEHAAFDPSKKRPADIVRLDTSLLMFYRKLCKMRKENPVLVSGDLTFTTIDDQKMILAYSRKTGNEEIIAVFNRSDRAQSLILPLKNGITLNNIFSTSGISLKNVESGIVVNLESLTSVVFKKKY